MSLEIRAALQEAKLDCEVYTRIYGLGGKNFYYEEAVKLVKECVGQDLPKFDYLQISEGQPVQEPEYFKPLSVGDTELGFTRCVLNEQGLSLIHISGAMVLGPTIALIDQFEPGMNSPELTDLTGIHLTNVQILPHYRQFLSRYEQLENRCQYYEKTFDCTVQRLNDGEGLMINPQNDRFIKIF